MHSARLQNTLLLLASYAVYYLLDAHMLWLLVVATAVAYAIGWGIEWLESHSKPRLASALTTAGVCLALALLFVFKYLDFFASAFVEAFTRLGIPLSWTALHLVLPVGLSFYSFKIISYFVDIHRGRLRAEHDVVALATYVAFFPTILAGPIDRPGEFLPQLRTPRRLAYRHLADGAKMMLWGAFMKICIADVLAPHTDLAWQFSYHDQHLALWAFLMYPVQMYADFSGYSLLAIGAGRMLGLRVTTNFRQPFLARNVAEYWHRWHISLTSWVTDYVFMPLNVRWRNLGRVGVAMAVAVNLVTIGLWHGANFTYLLFGLYHALLFIPLIYSGAFARNKKMRTNRLGLPTTNDVLRMLLTYLLVAVAFVLFRAPDVEAAFTFFAHLIQPVLPSLPVVSGTRWGYLLIIFAALAAEYVFRRLPSPLQFQGNGLLRHRIVRYAIYYALIFLIYAYSDGTAAEFIYTQF